MNAENRLSSRVIELLLAPSYHEDLKRIVERKRERLAKFLELVDQQEDSVKFPLLYEAPSSSTPAPTDMNTTNKNSTQEGTAILSIIFYLILFTYPLMISFFYLIGFQNLSHASTDNNGIIMGQKSPQDDNNYKKQKVVFSEKFDSSIEFNEAHHIYKINQLAARQSVTKYLDSIFGEFKRGIISLCTAKKSHLALNSLRDKQLYILSEYNYAAYLGTWVHKQIEYIANANISADSNGTTGYSAVLPIMPDEFTKFHEPGLSVQGQRLFYECYGYDRLIGTILNRMRIFRSFENVFSLFGRLIATEYMIWAEVDGQLLAGCVDAVFWKDASERTVILADWKTNKNLRTPYSAKVTAEQSPFYGESKNVLEKYECQLHAYSYILERNYGVTVADALIVNFTDQDYSLFSVSDHRRCRCRTMYNFTNRLSFHKNP